VLAAILFVTTVRRKLGGYIHTGIYSYKRRTKAHVHLCQKSMETENKNCSKILQKTLLNSVLKDLLLFMVGQSHDTCTLLSVKYVLFQHCQQAINCCAQSTDRRHSEANLSAK
jgi:hypothetical protein